MPRKLSKAILKNIKPLPVHYIERHGKDYAVCGHRVVNQDGAVLPSQVTCPICIAKMKGAQKL